MLLVFSIYHGSREGAVPSSAPCSPHVFLPPHPEPRRLYLFLLFPLNRFRRGSKTKNMINEKGFH